MRNIIHYITIHNENPESLSEAVTTAIGNGFQPFGSPYVIQKSDNFDVCQAMIKTQETRDELVQVGADIKLALDEIVEALKGGNQ